MSISHGLRRTVVRVRIVEDLEAGRQPVASWPLPEATPRFRGIAILSRLAPGERVELGLTQQGRVLIPLHAYPVGLADIATGVELGMLALSALRQTYSATPILETCLALGFAGPRSLVYAGFGFRLPATDYAEEQPS